jgi:transposase
MIIVGCDFHPGWQQVAIFDASTGEVAERKLVHGDGEAERFYRSLPVPALIGVEACGNSQWFLELLEGLGHEVWVGDAAQIWASRSFIPRRRWTFGCRWRRLPTTRFPTCGSCAGST